MHNASIRYIDRPADLESIKQEWETFYASTDASPYLSYEWISTAAEYFNRDDTWLFAVVTRQNEIIAIVPLQIVKEKLFFLHLPVLRFALDGWSLQNGAILPDHQPLLPVLQAVIRDLAMQKYRWLYSCLAKIPKDRWADVPESTSAKPCLHLVSIPVSGSVVITVPKTWEEYKKSLSAAHKKNLSRRLNAIERAGTVRFARLEPGSEAPSHQVARLLQDAKKVAVNSWQHRSPTGWAISDEGSGDFFIKVSDRLWAKGMLDISVLYLNEEPISFIWGAARAPYTSINKLGFDHAFAKLSPGFVHLALYIKDSIEKRIECIDFGHEYQDYKSGWSKSSVELMEIYFYPSKWFPLAIKWLRALKTQLRRHLA